MKICVRAPGKVVLLGEYAVLEGAPAVVMAVDRAVHATVETGRGRHHRVVSRPMAERPGRLHIGPDGSIGVTAGEAEAFGTVQRILEQLRMRIGLPDEPLCLELDSSQLYQRNAQAGLSKLGIGSSAALTVALAYGIRSVSGRAQLTPAEWLPILVETHRALQSGRGSGVDVAASLFGGAVEYRILESTPCARPLALPAGLHYRLVWSGRPASTSALLGRLGEWRKRHRRAYESLMRRMTVVSAQASEAARSNDTDRFLDAMGRYADELESLGTQTGLELFSRPHRDLAALAFRCGLVYKPCGAGAGDLGIAVGAQKDAVDRFSRDAARSGYPPLDIALDPQGVRIIRSH